MEVGVSGEYRFVFEPTSEDEAEEVVVPNGTTTEGLNYLLNCAFRGGVQYTNWYQGFVFSSYISSSHTDTFLGHPGWAEVFINNGITGTRFAWSIATTPPAGGVLEGLATHAQNTGQSPSTSVRGCFLTSSPDDASPGILFSTAIMNSPVTIPITGGVVFTYGIRLTPRS